MARSGSLDAREIERDGGELKVRVKGWPTIPRSELSGNATANAFGLPQSAGTTARSQ